MRMVVTAALVLSVALSSAAMAEKGGNPNKGRGNDKAWRPGPAGPASPASPPGHAKRFGAGDNGVIRAYYSQPFRGHCPPGLAKKNNGCLPPGHAKRWVVGHRLPAGVSWYAVPHDLYVRLTPPPYGHRYVYLDGGVLLLNLSTRFVVDAVTINVAVR